MNTKSDTQAERKEKSFEMKTANAQKTGRSLVAGLKLFNNRLGLHAIGPDGTQEDWGGLSFSTFSAH